MALAPWVPEEFAICRKKISLPSFLPCSSISSRCSFSICFTLALVRFLISALSLRYFSLSCNTLWNSVGEMSPSYIASEMISAILSNLLWASSIMASYFPCFTVWPLENFRVATVKRERATPSPPKAAPTGRPAPLANAGIEAPPAITAEIIKPASTIPMIVFNLFFFFVSRLRTSISARKKASISVNFFIQYAWGSCGAEGFKSG